MSERKFVVHTGKLGWLTYAKVMLEAMFPDDPDKVKEKLAQLEEEADEGIYRIES